MLLPVGHESVAAELADYGQLRVANNNIAAALLQTHKEENEW